MGAQKELDRFKPIMAVVGFYDSVNDTVIKAAVENPLPVENSYDYKYMAAQGQVKDEAGFLHNVIVGECSVAGNIDIYDNTTGDTTLIASLKVPQNPTPFSIVLNVKFSTGLFIVFSTFEGKITVGYR